MNVRPQGKEREGQFPHSGGVVPQLSAPDTWWLWGVALPTSGGCTLNVGWKQKPLPGPPVNLSFQKQNLEKSEYDTISFLRMSPVSCVIATLSGWPGTFPDAVDID